MNDECPKISIIKFSEYMKHNDIEFIKPKNKMVYIKIKRKSDLSDSDTLL